LTAEGGNTGLGIVKSFGNWKGNQKTTNHHANITPDWTSLDDIINNTTLATCLRQSMVCRRYI
jgi:hypothetical protein